MLELRLTCEHCNKALPLDSLEAPASVRTNVRSVPHALIRC